MLVAPVVKVNPSQERIVEFQGLNRRPMIEDGEMRDMWNVGSDDYPYLSQRKSRQQVSHSYVQPVQMLTKYEKLAVIDKATSSLYRFYYDGVMSDLYWSVQPRMVAIGTKICFFAEGIHQWYQVVDIEGCEAGTTGNLGANVKYTSDVGVWLYGNKMEIACGKQHMYEALSSNEPSTTEGMGAVENSMTSVSAGNNLSVIVGSRTPGTTQVRVLVQSTTLDNIRFISMEVGTQPVVVGTYVWRYAGYLATEPGDILVADYVDLADYETTNGVDIRVKAFGSDGNYYVKTVNLGTDFGWTASDFAAIRNEKTLATKFNVGDVIDVKGEVTSVSLTEGMTEGEYNAIATELGISTGSGTVDLNITTSEYNTLAALLNLEQKTSPAVDMTLSTDEVTNLARLEGLSIGNDFLKYYDIPDIDVSAEILGLEGEIITFGENSFTITRKSTETFVATENTLTIANAADIPTPTARYAVRSKNQQGRVLILWTCVCTTARAGTRAGTSYQVQARAAGTDEAWQVVQVLSSENGNKPEIAANGTTFVVTEVQTPAIETLYEFRVVAVNTSVRATGESGTTGIWPKCRAHNCVFAILQNLEFDRYCPDLDYVMEYNNRLWGCSNDTNELLACKLGDPTNWHYYQNTSLDSYAASQGTDGVWTGCAAYSNHLLFFKEEYIHKVYGSAPSSFQITTQRAHGVKEGSSKSVAIVNDIVLYHSRIGWMAYQGESPEQISAKLGDVGYANVVAGTDRKKYYCSAYNGSEWEMLVFDTETGFWIKEDDVQVIDFVYHEGLVMYADNSGHLLKIGAGTEANIGWYAVFGPFTEYIEDTKVISKLKMRLNLENGSSANVSISMDDDEWIEVGEYHSEDERSVDVNIVPRRCDRFEIKLEGIGRCRIDSLVRTYRTSRGKP